MRRVILVDGEHRNEALLVATGPKNARFGWRDEDVPAAYAGRVVNWETRSGLPFKALLLPRIGPQAVRWEEVVEDTAAEPDAAEAGGARKALGVATAELAKRLAQLLRERGLHERLEVICSHRGRYTGARKRELLEAGVLVCQLAMFLEGDHAFHTKLGVSDIAVAEPADPHRMLVLIEIEESKDGTKPKVVLGDGLLPFLADRVEIVESKRGRNRVLRTLSRDGTQVWVGYHPREGYDIPRTERLEACLNVFARKGRGEGGPASIRLFNQHPPALYETLYRAVEVLLPSREGQAGGAPAEAAPGAG
jgi:hypothetical protein